MGAGATPAKSKLDTFVDLFWDYTDGELSGMLLDCVGFNI